MTRHHDTSSGINGDLDVKLAHDPSWDSAVACVRDSMGAERDLRQMLTWGDRATSRQMPLRILVPFTIRSRVARHGEELKLMGFRAGRQMKEALHQEKRSVETAVLDILAKHS